MTVPTDPSRPSFDYAHRDRRHWSELDRLIQSEGIGTEDLLTNWPAYIRRRDMVRFLSHYELFKTASLDVRTTQTSSNQRSTRTDVMTPSSNDGRASDETREAPSSNAKKMWRKVATPVPTTAVAST